MLLRGRDEIIYCSAFLGAENLKKTCKRLFYSPTKTLALIEIKFIHFFSLLLTFLPFDAPKHVIGTLPAISLRSYI